MKKNISQLKTTEKMIGDCTRFPENDDLLLWRGLVVKIYIKNEEVSSSFWKVFSCLALVE